MGVEKATTRGAEQKGPREQRFFIERMSWVHPLLKGLTAAFWARLVLVEDLHSAQRPTQLICVPLQKPENLFWIHRFDRHIGQRSL